MTFYEKKSPIWTTRGHARFARSPLVIRLGDSRIRLGDSGYGEVLSSGWHYNIFGFAFKFRWKITVLNLLQGVPFWFCILWSTGMTIIMTFRPEKRYLYVHWHILFHVVLTWVTPHKLTHLCIWKKMVKIIFENVSKHFWKKNSKIILWSPNDDLPVDQSIQNKNGTPVKYVLFFFSPSVFKSPWSTWLWFHFMIDIRSIPYQAWTGVSLPGVDRCVPTRCGQVAGERYVLKRSWYIRGHSGLKNEIIFT